MKTDSLICASCGAGVIAGALRCKTCGAAFRGSRAVPQLRVNADAYATRDADAAAFVARIDEIVLAALERFSS